LFYNKKNIFVQFPLSKKDIVIHLVDCWFGSWLITV